MKLVDRDTIRFAFTPAGVRHLFKRTTLKKYGARIAKIVLQKIRGEGGEPAIPVFILGLQRSGTTMLEYVFDLSPQTWVCHERENDEIYTDYRIDDFGAVEAALARSNVPFVVFKPISDSHRILDFIEAFPSGKAIWIYRNFRDSANSWHRRWQDIDTALHRLFTRVTTDGEVTGDEVAVSDEAAGICEFLGEGLTPQGKLALRERYSTDLGRFDVLSLAWFARNVLVIEKGLADQDRVLLVGYDDLVRDREGQFAAIFRFLGMDVGRLPVSDVHTRSVGKHPFPAIDPEVESLCDELEDALSAARRASWARLGLEELPPETGPESVE